MKRDLKVISRAEQRNGGEQSSAPTAALIPLRAGDLWSTIHRDEKMDAFFGTC